MIPPSDLHRIVRADPRRSGDIIARHVRLEYGSSLDSWILPALASSDGAAVRLLRRLASAFVRRGTSHLARPTHAPIPGFEGRGPPVAAVAASGGRPDGGLAQPTPDWMDAPGPALLRILDLEAAPETCECHP